MIVIRHEIWIAAAPEVCFDLCLDVSVHQDSAAQTGERVVRGRTEGKLELGEEITFQGRHFGIVFNLTAKVTQLERPQFFVDEMVRGPFRSLWHEHRFEASSGGTSMVDETRVSATFGPLGWLAERVLIRRHLAKFLRKRAEYIKQLAEGLATGRPVQ
ncbi:MAG: SRPBCC family protein [Fimbriimonadaceae bacterium]|nr:SRPBCC family protein [Fimbriimonadaceae bacterium]